MSFSAQQKLKIVFEGLNKENPITDICEKYNISRQTFYDWKNELADSALNNWENKQVGRKSKDQISSIEKAQRKLDELQQKKEQLEEELQETKKESAIYQLQRDYIKFSLTEDDIDPKIKAKNQELLKKSDFQPPKNDGS